ncbi:uncharacterized protein AB675_3750 [Cyphellophora attinorum]|uniref:Nucleoporin POM34 n=1 Tax=Cyphellophora attinorum TaxID=1664694 RepID=A0A0N1H386_9EURO|nr:uncharacterized protein AB675_3750 [Phialophora attinorum]KPI35234.1 hypothetical protein AB675_3750 [Phialophora attinorum]
MSTTATSLVPTPARSAFNNALATTNNAVTAASKALPTPMQTAPSTPTTQPAEARPSPGTFRHPRLAEIVRRQNQTLLTQSNVRSAAINVAALVLSIAFRSILSTIITTLLKLTPLSAPTARDTAATILLTLRILFFINILLSLRQSIPYISKTDTIDDIPLTPSQRALLGLPASASGSPAVSRSGSPLAPPSPGFSPSPTTAQTQPKASAPYSYSPAGDRGSPLFHKAIERQQRRQSQSDFDVSGLGRSSFGDSSGSGGLGRSQSVKGGPAAAAKKGVNFKWLYDQEYNLAGGGFKRSTIGAVGSGRGLSSSQSMHF